MCFFIVVDCKCTSRFQQPFYVRVFHWISMPREQLSTPITVPILRSRHSIRCWLLQECQDRRWCHGQSTGQSCQHYICSVTVLLTQGKVSPRTHKQHLVHWGRRWSPPRAQRSTPPMRWTPLNKAPSPHKHPTTPNIPAVMCTSTPTIRASWSDHCAALRTSGRISSAIIMFEGAILPFKPLPSFPEKLVDSATKVCYCFNISLVLAFVVIISKLNGLCLERGHPRTHFVLAFPKCPYLKVTYSHPKPLILCYCLNFLGLRINISCHVRAKAFSTTSPGCNPIRGVRYIKFKIVP